MKRSLLHLGFAISVATLSHAVAGTNTPSSSPPSSATGIPELVESAIKPGGAAFDVAKVAADARPAVVFITVTDKAGKTKYGTGFFVAADGKLVTNAHVLDGAVTAEVKLENSASYRIVGILKAAVNKDLVIAKAEAKGVPFLRVATGDLPQPGTRIVVVGSPLGFEGTVSEGIVSGQRSLKRGDDWLQITAAISRGSSGSPVINSEGKVVGVATFIIEKGQSVNFARPAAYAAELLSQIADNTEPAPLWTLAPDEAHVVLNDPDFIEAEKALQNSDPAGALKRLNKLQSNYAENATYLLELALVYDHLGLLDDAVKTYQHALKIDPTNGLGWTNLSLVYVKMASKYEEANNAALQAVKQAPDFAPAWEVLAYTYRQLGKASESADAVARAAKLKNGRDSSDNLSDGYSHMVADLQNSSVPINVTIPAVVAASSPVASAPASAASVPTVSATPMSQVAAPTSSATSQPQRTLAVVTAPASKGLNIRSAPDSDSRVVATLHPQDRVYLDGGRLRNNAPPMPLVWQQVTSLSGASGWFVADYLNPHGPATAPESSIDQQVWKLFEKWLSVNNTDPSGEAALYSDPVDYLDLGNISRGKLNEELSNDLKVWPQQHNKLTSGPVVEKLNDNEWRVTFELRFDVRNPATLKRVTGKSNFEWQVRRKAEGEGVEITSAKTKVTERKFSKGSRR
ncbi:MAG: trypsin-like peptidase domain-containing protein [Verrucomicrobiota bacterium]|nr:trypsin-like peptidase domain-containing protein [Verrucomicrobiota bacterium]